MLIYVAASLQLEFGTDEHIFDHLQDVQLVFGFGPGCQSEGRMRDMVEESEQMETQVKESFPGIRTLAMNCTEMGEFCYYSSLYECPSVMLVNNSQFYHYQHGFAARPLSEWIRRIQEPALSTGDEAAVPEMARLFNQSVYFAIEVPDQSDVSRIEAELDAVKGEAFFVLRRGEAVQAAKLYAVNFNENKRYEMAADVVAEHIRPFVKYHATERCTWSSATNFENLLFYPEGVVLGLYADGDDTTAQLLLSSLCALSREKEAATGMSRSVHKYLAQRSLGTDEGIQFYAFFNNSGYGRICRSENATLETMQLQLLQFVRDFRDGRIAPFKTVGEEDDEQEIRRHELTIRRRTILTLVLLAAGVGLMMAAKKRGAASDHL